MRKLAVGDLRLLIEIEADLGQRDVQDSSHELYCLYQRRQQQSGAVYHQSPADVSHFSPLAGEYSN